MVAVVGLLNFRFNAPVDTFSKSDIPVKFDLVDFGEASLRRTEAAELTCSGMTRFASG